MNIGQTLSSRRRALGLSIDDLASSTGMSPRQLRAIESLSTLPPESAELRRMLLLYARKTGLLPEVEHFLAGCAHRAGPSPVQAPEASIPRFLLKQSLAGSDGLWKQ